MSGNNDFEKLWRRQETEIPDVNGLFEKTRKFKARNLGKVMIANILLLSTSVYMAYTCYREQPEMTATKIGIALVILAMILYLFVYNQLIPLLMKVEYAKNSNQYLQQLLKIKEKQRFLQNTMLNIYFLLLSTGIFTFMYEYISQMSLLWAIFSYAVTFIWIAVNWFFIRPRTIKKQEAKINELIAKFKALNKQLLSDE